MIWAKNEMMAAIARMRAAGGGDQVLNAELMKLTGRSGRQVANACYQLEKQGYLTHQHYADDSVKPGHYLLTELGKNLIAGGIDQARLKSGPRAPCPNRAGKSGTLRERAWRLLRIKEKEPVSINYLLSVLLDAEGTEQGEVQSAAINLQRYLSHLKRADYLAEVRPLPGTRQRDKRYLLIRNTGPLPPVLKIAAAQVFDQNQQVHYDIVN